MNQHYKEKGFFVVRQFLSGQEVLALSALVLEFHDSWRRKHAEFYTQRAVNSAYLTGTEHLDETRRKALFQFLGSARLMKAVSEVIPGQAAFVNTQLFFNPVSADQKNYWHRDTQYHLSIDGQKAALTGPEVAHFRIPLANEPGIELVPGSHRRWDSDEELDVRLEQNGRLNHEDISTGLSIELEAGDLLVFSANMLHRGLYGMQRMALDILFCAAEPELMQFVDEDCLPAQEILQGMEDPSAFLNTISLKARSKTAQTTST